MTRKQIWMTKEAGLDHGVLKEESEYNQNTFLTGSQRINKK